MGKVIQSYCCQQIQITLPQVYNLLLNTQKTFKQNMAADSFYTCITIRTVSHFDFLIITTDSIT